MNINNLTYLLVGIFLGGIVSYFVFGTSESGKTFPVEKQTEERSEKQSNFISISEETLKEFGIRIDVAGAGKLTIHKDLTGEIVPNPYEVAHIVPRFAGVVKEVFKEIGDKINKGEKIAVIESNESLVRYDVKSSINGTILELHMTPGELIGDENHIVTIANLNTVWAELNIYQKDLGEVKTGQKIEISSPHSEKKYLGRLFYISPTVDEATRTAVARVNLDNSSGVWKPGMFVSGKVFTSTRRVKIAVPKNAVQILDGQKVVFVKSEKGFAPRTVTVGIENGKSVEILDGLHEGETYVAEGAFTFKSELLKESFGGEHDH